MIHKSTPGYEVTTMEEAVKKARVYVTTTGNKDIIRACHFNEVTNSVCRYRGAALQTLFVGIRVQHYKLCLWV